jgi:hypothetical protein
MADVALDVPDYRRLELLNDELAIVRRLLNKPHAASSAPEVMDVLRMAVDYTHSRMETLACEMRNKARTANAK